MRRDIPRLPGSAVEALSSPGSGLVRFPCGHTDAEAYIAGAIRERKTSIWVCCPRCNVIALAIAEIEMQ